MTKSSSTPHTPVIEIKDLHKSFGKNHVLRGFDFTLLTGENVAILGKSGSGKSVLIKCIIGLIPIDSGYLSVLGQPISDLSAKELDHIRRDVGFLFQGSALYDSMSVRENLEFPLRRHQEIMGTSQTMQMRVEEALDSVGLLHTMDLMPSELSGGMKKRVALARALFKNPKVIFLDEPTTGLDPINSDMINELIIRIIKKKKMTAVTITHDIQSALKTSDSYFFLNNGVVEDSGKCNLMLKSKNKLMNEFLLGVKKLQNS